jgi:hypothetical protein
VPFTNQLTDIGQAIPCHVGGACIADVCVVFPYQALGAGPVVAGEPVDGVGHVLVSKIPGIPIPAHHDAVLPLGMSSDDGVLGGVERGLVCRRIPARPQSNLDNRLTTSASQDSGTSRVLQAYSWGSSRYRTKHGHARSAGMIASGALASSQEMISRK